MGDAAGSSRWPSGPWILAGILLAALVLRLVAVGDRLSHDEGYTWLVVSSDGPGTFLDRMAAFENTPPLYYLLTWPFPDEGVAWLRIVSVLAGVGCVAAVAWVVRGRAGLLAAAALAVAPYAVSFSDYARGFVLADLGLLIALGAAMRGRWWVFMAGGAVAVYSEYDSALFLAAMAPLFGWRCLVPVAFLAPWIPQIVRAQDALDVTKVAPVYPDPGLDSLRDTVVRLAFGEHGTAGAAGLRWLQLLAVVLVLALAMRALARADARLARVLGVVGIGTLALHALAHWIGPDVFAPRYLTELIPLGAAAIGAALAQARVREVRVAAAVAIAALGVAVVVQRWGENDEPDYDEIAALVEPGARGRTVITNSAVIAYYLRDLDPHLDRPFGLGPGLEAACAHPCREPFLVVDDMRVANSPRLGAGRAQAFGPVYVRATPQVGGGGAVDRQGEMSSLACSIALLLASSFGGVGSAHPMEVTVQDDALFLHRPHGEVMRSARRLAHLGADRLRVTAGWSALAPGARSRKRPAFDATESKQYRSGPFRALDTAVKSARAAGLEVQIDLAFWAPRWAVKRRVARSTRQRWRPDPVAFGQFAKAVARRYDGNHADPTSRKGKPLPAVRMWTTWNEPNHPSFLLPQSERDGRGRWRDVAPHTYRAMHEAAYNALKEVDRDNKVLVGGLSSRGASRSGPERNIPPLRFMRRMACLDDRLLPLRDPACRDFHPIQADGFAYHPYSLEGPPDVPAGGPDSVNLANLDGLSQLLDELHKRGRISAKLPLYLTEYGYETNPPDTRRGVPPETQARYMSHSSYLAWRNPETRMFAQFLLQDIADPSSYQTGLLYPDGRDKPAVQAFKLPFWAQAREANGQTFVQVWGQVRPGSGPQSVALEAQRSDGTWHTVPSFETAPRSDGRECPADARQFLTDDHGFYQRLVPYQGVVAYRARWMRPDGGVDYAPPVTVGTPTP